MITHKMKIIKKCAYCGGELKPTADFFKQNGKERYERMKKEFKVFTGKEWEEPKGYNCIECGVVYDEYFRITNFKLGWCKKNDKSAR